MTQLIIPEMGSNTQAEVIEILIAEGDQIDVDQSTLVLESEKSTIEVPANQAGIITQLVVKVGDKFTGGEVYAELSASSASPKEAVKNSPKESSSKPESRQPEPPQQIAAAVQTASVPSASTVISSSTVLANKKSDEVYAGPAVRLLARELGVNLADVQGRGLKGRIQKEDVHNFVKQRMQGGIASGVGIPQVAEIDFSQFGSVRHEPLNNIKRATAKAMTIANLNVPQVTQFDEVDITDLEAFRQQQETKTSIVPFVMKALAQCLLDYPRFNSSLNAQGDGLVMKEYVNIGVAVDTPKGLLVPVVRNINQKNITQIRQELQDKAELARQGKLSLVDMQGGSMSLSSLGGIGGTAFTPIVNPPEVAILGLSKARMQPVWQNGAFVPRLMLPLSLSYDHRVIDGAEAARFSQTLVRYLQDVRYLLM